MYNFVIKRVPDGEVTFWVKREIVSLFPESFMFWPLQLNYKLKELRNNILSHFCDIENSSKMERNHEDNSLLG